MNGTATNIEITKLIETLFMGYDRFCFKMGNYIQETKKTARYITDEIYSCDFSLDIIKQGIRQARDESPKKPPTLTEILIKCNRIKRHLEIVESNRLYDIREKKELEAIEYMEKVTREELEKRVAVGDPFAKIILGLKVR